MKNKKTLIILILAFVVLLGGAYFLYSHLGQSQAPDQLSVEQQENNETEAERQENKKTPAPDFTVYDADGNEVKLYDFFGKPIVLNFWASWSILVKILMDKNFHYYR